MRNLLFIILTLLPSLSFAQVLGEGSKIHMLGDADLDTLQQPFISCRQYDDEHPLVYTDYSDLPPYSFNDGSDQGYNVELVKFLLERLGIKHVVRLQHIGDAYEDLHNGNADLILGIKSKKRGNDGVYGRVPIAVFTTSLMMPKSKPLDIHRLRELGDNRVYVHTGSYALDIMQERDLIGNAMPISDMTQTIIKIANEDNGLVLWNTMALKYIIRQGRLSNLQLKPIYDLHTELQFFSHDTLLLRKLDSVYLVHQSDADLLDLRRKWFYPEVEVEQSPFLTGMLGGMVILGVISMLVYFWYRHRERQYAFQLEQQNLHLSLYLKTGGIVMWTYKVAQKQFCQLDGQGEEEMVMDPTTFGRNYHKDDFATTLVAIEQIATGVKENHKDTVRMFGPDGQFLYYNLLLTVLDYDSRKHPRIILGVQSNTTEQRQKRLELQEATLKFHTAFNVSNAWLLSFDRDGWLKNINHTACTAFGIENPEALIKEGFKMEGLPFDFSYTGLARGEKVWMSAQTDFDKRRVEGRLSRHITAKGQVFHELIVMPVTSGNGTLLATYVAGINITDSVETARESRERQREIEYLYGKSRLGMDQLSHSLAFAQVRMGIYSPGQRSLSFADDGVMSNLSPLRLMVMVEPEDRYRMVHIFNRLDKRFVRRYGFKCHTRLNMPNGMGKRVFDISVLPVTGDDGLADHYIVLTRDISEVEHIEAQLAKETAKAQEAEQIKNAFLRNMSAEIRRPLNRMMQSATELSQLPAILDGGGGGKADVLADDIHQTCRNLLALVGDILTLSKIEAGMEKTTIETVDMAVLFPAVCQMSSGACDSSRIKVKAESAYDSMNIDTDTNFLTRIIEGLFRCAIMSTERGVIKASYEYYNGQLVIRVDDTGAGMSPDQIAAVAAHRFSGASHQYDHSIKLAIVQELARCLNGKLDIESVEDHGTTVWVTLPCVLHDFKLHTATDNETA